MIIRCSRDLSVTNIDFKVWPIYFTQYLTSKGTIIVGEQPRIPPIRFQQGLRVVGIECKITSSLIFGPLMPSTAIVGESLFFEAARVLNGANPISYYQYKAVESLLEVLAFHDSVVLLVGEETDKTYLDYFDSLITTIHEQTDFRVDLVLPREREHWITSSVMARFDEISRELYHHSLGTTSNDLFTKQRKDRTSEDMAEHLEQLFIRDYPSFVPGRFGEDVYELSVQNANSSELLYFFRAHLIQALSEANELTPMYENQRLIAGIFHFKGRATNRIGTLPYAIYKMANSLFIKSCAELSPDSKIDYPRTSIGMHAVTGTAATRGSFLTSAFKLREELKDFRKSYADAEEVLVDPNRSLSDKTKVRSQLENSVDVVWIPLITSFGHSYTSSNVKKLARGVFGKYGVGVGEVTVEHSDKAGPSEGESTATFSTSLVGLAAAITTTLVDIRKDSRLRKPNQSLVDVLLKVVEMEGTKQKLSGLLPVRDFSYKTPQLIDSLMVHA
jgi:hypothetical protein